MEVTLHEHEAIVDMRNLDMCIDRLQNGVSWAKAHEERGYLESAADGTLEWLKRLRDRARTA